MSSSVFTLTNRLNYLQAQVNGIIASSNTLQDVIDDGDLLEGVAPALDQVIKYDGTNVVWSDLPVPPADQSLQDVINVSPDLNGSAPTGAQFIGYNGATPFWTDLPFVTLDDVVIESPDLNGVAPAVNQVIQYDGEFVVWSDLPAPPATPSLQEVITVNDDLQSTAPTLDQVIKYNGTNVVWSDLPAPPATPTLSSVLSAGNTASGTSASVSLTNLPKQTIISPTSVFLNDTTIVQQATLNTEKLRLLTTGLTNDITSGKMSFTKLSTSSINEYGTDGVALSGLFGAETRTGGLNLNTGVTINNVTGKLSGTLNESFVSLDGNNSSTVLGTKSTLNATGLTCLNKVTQSSNSSLSSSGLTVGITGSVLTASSSGLSSTNILNLNATNQIDTNCAVRVLAVPPSSAGRSILSNSQLSMQNVSPSLQNNMSSTSASITNGTKTITMTVDGLSSTGAMSLGTATVALTTGSTGITQTYPSNSTALATTQYVTTAISAIPASATPTLQSVTNQGNTITNGTKTLTLNVNGLDSTGEIVIGNVSGTTQLNGTTTATKLQSLNYDSINSSLSVKLANSLITGNLELGNNLTTGNINLGSKMTTGNLYIMNDALASGNITILNPSATGKLFVKGTGIDTNTIIASELKTPSINALSAVQDLDIGNNATDTTISIGRLMIADGQVNIGSTASTINLVSNDCNSITQTTGNNTTRVATCAFVNSSISVIPVPSLQAVINKNDDLQGATPTTNQFIKYNGSNVIWSDLPASTTPSLQAVVTVSDVLNGGAPTTNQVIQYNGSAVAWANLPAPTTPSLSTVLLAGNGAGTSNLNMNSQNITAVNNITVSTINNVAYPPPAIVNTLQQVLNAGNSANKTIILSDSTVTNTLRPQDIVLTTTGSSTSTYNPLGITFTPVLGAGSRTVRIGTTGLSTTDNDTAFTSSILGQASNATITQSSIDNSSGLGTTSIHDTTNVVFRNTAANTSGSYGSSTIINTNTSDALDGYLTTLNGEQIEIKQKNILGTASLLWNNLTITNLLGTVKSVLDSGSLIITGLTGIITYGLTGISANLNYGITTTGTGTLTLTSAGDLSLTTPNTLSMNSTGGTTTINSSTMTNINTTNNAPISIGGTGSGAINLGGSGPAPITIGGIGTTDLNLNSIATIDITSGTSTNIKSIIDTSINSTGNGSTTIGGTGNGLITLGGSGTTNVNISTQTGRSVVLHLGDGASNIAGSGVHINNGLNSVGNTQINNSSGQTGQINIGNAASGTTTTTIAGTTNINTSGTTTTTIGIQSSTINVRGGVNINTNGTGGFSSTTIGVNGSTTAINGTLNINTSGGGSTTIGTTNSGTNTLRGSISNMTGTTNNITGITNINTTGTSNTNIGNSTGILTINSPITSTYSTVPTSDQLGFIPTTIFNAGDVTLQVNNFTMTAFTNYSFAKVELTAGTWILTGSLVANTNSSFGSVICAITPTQAAFSTTTDLYVQSANNSFITLGFLAARIVQVTATQFYFLTARSSATSQVVNTYKLIATRIA